eukprot:Lithocolla_globosa_v1_NODE_4513_length_1419_cov_41.185484.p1 type:complete len:447 gc:universal NODE_4513_length_1419_cov_41.185484:67-1407(+)
MNQIEYYPLVTSEPHVETNKVESEALIETANEAEASKQTPLSQFLDNLHDHPQHCDVKFWWKDSDNVVLAHAFVLARSACLNNPLAVTTSLQETSILVPSNISHNSLQNFLWFIYHYSHDWSSGKLDLSELSSSLSEAERSYFKELLGDVETTSLHQHMEQVLESGFHTDLVLTLKEEGPEEEKEEMTRKAHRAMLSLHSDFFARMFRGGMAESRTGSVCLVGLDSPTLDAILHYVYTGDLNRATDESIVLNVLEACEQYQFQQLKQHCLASILSGFQDGSVDVTNVLDILTLSQRLKFPELKNRCLVFIVQHFSLIKQEVSFVQMPPEMIEEMKAWVMIHSNPVQPLSASQNQLDIPDMNEMFCILKETLVSQESRMKDAIFRYQQEQQRLEQGNMAVEEAEHLNRSLEYWQEKIGEQQAKLVLLRSYIERHEKIIENVSKRFGY